MRVEEKKNIKVEDIEPGECFKRGDEIFLKTDGTEYGYRMCVDIRYGTLYRLEEEYMVAPINVKAVVK